MLGRATPERLSIFSDGVFAVLITVLVLVALRYPLVGLAICTCCLIVYLSPEPPWTEKQFDEARQD